jgi:hypothetical protein
MPWAVPSAEDVQIIQRAAAAADHLVARPRDVDVVIRQIRVGP